MGKPKIWDNSKTADNKAKLTKRWESTTVHTRRAFLMPDSSWGSFGYAKFPILQV